MTCKKDICTPTRFDFLNFGLVQIFPSETLLKGAT